MKKARSSSAAPPPAFIEPAVAKAVTVPPSDPAFVHEIKYDGYRMQMRKEGANVALMTRRGHDWTARFPLVGKAFAALPANNAVIDGEMIVEDARGVSSFAALVQSIGSKRFAAQAFVAFDLMHLNGESWLERPLVARKAQLAALVGALAPKSPVRYGEHLEGDGRLILEQAARLGVEGLVSKRRDRPYRPGGGDWLKVKLRFSDEFVVVGWLAHATGKQAVGALVLAFHDGGQLVYVGRTGTGFTAKAASALWEVLQPLATSPPPFAKALPAGQKRGVEWVVPRLVAQVDYLGWTTDRLLRAAAFKGLREDKPPGDVGRPPGYPA